MKAVTLTLDSSKVTVSQKLLALLNLRRSLIHEKYEECSAWVMQARDRGATHGEISKIVKDPWGSLRGIEGN